jgi:hypothetical protein
MSRDGVDVEEPSLVPVWTRRTGSSHTTVCCGWLTCSWSAACHGARCSRECLGTLVMCFRASPICFFFLFRGSALGVAENRCHGKRWWGQRSALGASQWHAYILHVACEMSILILIDAWDSIFKLLSILSTRDKKKLRLCLVPHLMQNAECQLLWMMKCKISKFLWVCLVPSKMLNFSWDGWGLFGFFFPLEAKI